MNEIEKHNDSEMILYTSEDGQIKLDVSVDGDTVWLSQAQMVELFQTSLQNIALHIKNIYDEGELVENRTIKDSLIVQLEGTRQVQRAIKFYNLDVIISVGYRVKSHRGTQFRIWATERLREYIIKGFTMNDELLKKAGGGDHWDELLERIRDIRSSEKLFYRKVLDIYATSADYDPNTDMSRNFFQTVQNKMHYAVHGKTAAELIYDRVDADKDFMGLTVFSGDKPKKSDVVNAKNFMTADELKVLNRLVNIYLDFAELQAMERNPMYMKDWIQKLDEFLAVSGRQQLRHAGRISHDVATRKASIEYEKYKRKTDNELSSVEKDYLKNIKDIEKQLKDNNKDK